LTPRHTGIVDFPRVAALQILQAIEVDYIDESEVLTMADEVRSTQRPIEFTNLKGNSGLVEDNVIAQTAPLTLHTPAC
jgi:hypothetical protein